MVVRAEAEQESARPDIEFPVAFPTLRRAAQLLGVDPSTLSHRIERGELPYEQVGREKRLPPLVVMELAAYYRRRSLSAVAGALVKNAFSVHPHFGEEVRAEVESFLDACAEPAPEDDAFLDEARRSLPPTLYAEVEKAYRARGQAERRGAVSLGLEDDETHAA